MKKCFFPWCGVGGKLCIDCKQASPESAGPLRLLLIDCDGVLTNNEVVVDQNGGRFKVFHARDSRAIAELCSQGWEVHVVSASGWSGLKAYLDRSPAIVHVGCSKTEEELEGITGGRDYVAVGDDAWDVTMLRGARKAFCPSDADASVRSLPNVKTLNTAGGRGVIADLVRLLNW